MSNRQSEIVVITGATGGLGSAIARLYRDRGDVVLNLSRSCDPLEEGNYVCDVADAVRVREVFAAIAARYGRIDRLINNAGYGLGGATELLDRQEARRNMDVNFFGALYCSQAALAYMKRGGRIVNISSAAGMFPLPFRSMYSASKAALNILGESMRMEVADSGVDVVTVCPGDVKTSFSAHRVKLTETNFRYGERVKRAIYKAESNQDKRMSPGVVAAKIVRISDRRRTKPCYVIGAKYKFFVWAQRIMPTGWYHALIRRMYGGY